MSDESPIPPDKQLTEAELDALARRSVPVADWPDEDGLADCFDPRPSTAGRSGRTTTMNATHEQINEALARKLGWTLNQFDEWDAPSGKVEDTRAGLDYFAPAGSCELEDWLLADGWRIDVHHHGVWCSVTLSPVTAGARWHQNASGNTSAARRDALARAAFAALCQPEVPRVE